MSKRKQVRKPKPVVIVDDTVADKVMQEAAAMSAGLDDVVLPPEPVDEWRVWKITAPRSLIAIRTSDQFKARVRVRDSARYRRGVVVDTVGSLATGLNEGKVPQVKRIEVAS